MCLSNSSPSGSRKLLHQNKNFICIAIWIWALLLPIATAQFDTVVNIPTDSFPETIQPNTQINISAWRPSVTAQVGSSNEGTTDVEINLLNGSYIDCFDDIYRGVTFNIEGGFCEGPLNAHEGSTISMSGGTAFYYDDFPSTLRAGMGSTVRVTGGKLGRLTTRSGSNVEISQGIIHSLSVGDGSQVSINGGAVYGIETQSGSDLTLFGNDFRLNGNPVSGLREIGDRVSVQLGESVDLTGSLTDGNLFFATGESTKVTLELTDIPMFVPQAFRVAFNEPTFVRNGSKLIVDRSVVGDVVGLYGSEVEFLSNGSLYSRMTLFDSKLVRRGGSDPEWGTGDLRTIRSDVEIYGGDSVFTAIDSSTVFAGGIYEIVNFHGGTATLSDGSIDQLEATDGANINLTGTDLISARFVDSVFRFDYDEAIIWGTTTARNSHGVVNAGDVDLLLVEDGSQLTVRGGLVRTLSASGDSRVALQGGTVAVPASARWNISDGAEFHIFGTALELDGQPIAGLDSPGDSIVLPTRDDRTLAGILLDGNEFSYTLSEAAFQLDSILRLTVAVPFGFCDFDNSGTCDAADVQMFQSMIGETNGGFDLNYDGQVTQEDVDVWLANAGELNIGRPYLSGDLTLDGSVGALDLAIIAENWQTVDAGFAGGDLNLDGVVDAADLNEVGRNWNMIGVPAAVPEPTNWGWICTLGFVMLAKYRPTHNKT